MEQKQENPIKLLLSWSGKSKRYLFASVACAFASGLFVIGPYIGIYNLMDAILSENITQRLLVNNKTIRSQNLLDAMTAYGEYSKIPEPEKSSHIEVAYFEPNPYTPI